ncbi:MAG TPA: DUF3761 domain-containing protein [Gaiellaceae bacterium]|nr:DUF3761 domain-containing protein [Gaiellaceae bacterium]
MRRIAVLVATAAVAFGASGVASAHPTAADCSKGYYKNVSGHCVHSPAASPVGATARCRDGTYSYSEHASGTCSYHGGVAVWIHHP